MTWRFGLSTGACSHRSILDVLPAIHAAGALGVEVSTPPGHFDPWRDDEIVVLGERLTASSIAAVSIHAPFGGQLDLAHPGEPQRREAIEAAIAAAAAVKRLGGWLVIVHPSDLQRDGSDVQARLQDSARSLAMVADGCRREGVTLAIESPLPHLVGGHPDEFGWLLGGLDESVRVCLDTGHTTLGGHWRRFLEVADGRTVHVHAHDNHGHGDDHLPPGEGRIEWAEIGRTLSEAGFDGWIMLELLCPPDDAAPYFRRALERTRQILRWTGPWGEGGERGMPAK